MSKLARALAVGVLLMAMSLGGTAYAEDDQAQSQPANITESDPSQVQPPGEPDPQDSDTPQNPGGSEDPDTPQNPDGSAGPGTTPGDPAASAGSDSTPRPTTTTPPDDDYIRPESLPVTVSPKAGGRGTTVTITARTGQCPLGVHIWFYDSKSDGVTEAGGAKRVGPWRISNAGTLTASYTLTRRDATGPARFSVVCSIDDGHFSAGDAGFRVLASNSQGSGGSPSGGNDQTPNRNDTQLPNRIDTGLGGTADDGDQGGLDPTRLLLPAGLLLLVIGAGLGLRHSVRSRR